LIWSVQILEWRAPSLGVVLRAHARQVASSIALLDGSLIYHENKTSVYEADLNAIELAVDPGSSKKATLAPRHDIIMSPRGTGLGRALMSLLIRRAKERFADRSIRRATLGVVQSRVTLSTRKEGASEGKLTRRIAAASMR
jgi:hypothetical protein